MANQILVAAIPNTAVVLHRGSVEPQGFDEVVSRVRWTFSDILTYYK